jgi:hypothetical protein
MAGIAALESQTAHSFALHAMEKRHEIAQAAAHESKNFMPVRTAVPGPEIFNFFAGNLQLVYLLAFVLVSIGLASMVITYISSASRRGRGQRGPLVEEEVLLEPEALEEGKDVDRHDSKRSVSTAASSN